MADQAFPLLVPISKTTIATQAIVSIKSLELGKSVSIFVALMDNNGQRLENRMYNLEGQDYANWGTDDLYIQHWVQETLAREVS